MKRIVWLDLLRIFSIFFVIMIHVTSINWYTETPSSFDFNVLNFYNGISRFCVPVFVMLSGALLLSKKNIDIKTFYKKNILRLIIALIFWGLFYALLTTIFSNKSFFEFIKNFNEIHYHLEFILNPLVPIVGQSSKSPKMLVIVVLPSVPVTPIKEIFSEGFL